MKVILLEKYKKLGQVGEIAEVKNGYARNFLIPNGKAVQATKQNIANFEAKKAELIKQSEANEAAALKVAKSIENKIVTIIKQAGDDGRLYGSVATSEIAEELNKNVENEISRKQITINSSIKFLGFYQVEIDLGESVFVNIFVNVSRTSSEAKEIEEQFSKGKISLGPLRSSSEDEKKQQAEEFVAAPAAEKAEEVTEEEASENTEEVA